MGSEGLRAVRTFATTWRCSTHPVEVDHKRCKDDMHSETTGSGQSHAGRRAVVRHFRAAWEEKGNGNPVARVPAKRSQPRPLASQSGGAGNTPPQLAITDDTPSHDLAIVPRSEVADGGVTCRAVDCIIAHDTKALGGGNPRMMYINYQLRADKIARASSTISKEQRLALQKQYGERFDKSEQMQKRWALIFKIVQTRRRMQTGLEPPPFADTVALKHVWGEVSKCGEDGVPLPMGASILAEHFAEKFGTMRRLDQMAKDATEFVVDARDVRKRTHSIDRSFGSLWGCLCEVHNVCVHGMDARRRRQYLVLIQGFATYVDKVKKTARDVEVLLCLTRVGDDGSEQNAIVLLGSAMFRPKSQVFVKVAILSLEHETRTTGFCGALPDFPWVCKMLTRPSSLCMPGNASFTELCMETTAMLANRLSSTGEGWRVRALKYTMTEHTDLMHMHVTGFSDEGSLLSAVRTPRAPDVFVAWLQRQRPRKPPTSRPPRSSAPRAAPAAANMADEGDSADEWVDALGAALRPDEADLGEESDAGDENLGEEGGANDLDAGHICEDLIEDAAEHLLGRTPVEEDIFGDFVREDPPADPEPSEEDLEILGRLASVSGDLEPSVEAAMPAPSLGAVVPDAPAAGSGASSSTDMPQVAQLATLTPAQSGAESVAEKIEISDRGYVSRTVPPSVESRVIGRVTSFGTNVSAACRMHQKCSWISTRASREQMVQWLAAGRYVPWTAPEAERAAARDQHLEARPVV